MEVVKPDVFSPALDALTSTVGPIVVVVVVDSEKIGFCCGVEVDGWVETGGGHGAIVTGVVV